MIDSMLEGAEAVKKWNDLTNFSRRLALLVTLDEGDAFDWTRWYDMLQALEYSFRLTIWKVVF